jgi:VanZ family protein
VKIPVVLRWSLVAAWIGAIYWASSRSEPGPDPGIPFFDKIEHLIAYGTGGFLFAAALRASGPGIRPAAAILITALFGLLHGGFDEIHQSFVPNREPSLGDLATDVVAALLGGAVHALWRSWRHCGKVRPASPGADNPRA